MTFAEYTRLRRTEAGVSLQAVADALELPHRSMVHRRETGETEWKFSEVIKLTALLQTKLSEFVAGWENTAI